MPQRFPVVSTNMTKRIEVDFSDDEFNPIERAAREMGMSPAKWAALKLTALAPTKARLEEAMRALRASTDAIDFGDSDNESIDRDLAREYGNLDQTDAA
jgi:hypothetical protein